MAANAWLSPALRASEQRGDGLRIQLIGHEDETQRHVLGWSAGGCSGGSACSRLGRSGITDPRKGTLRRGFAARPPASGVLGQRQAPAGPRPSDARPGGSIGGWSTASRAWQGRRRSPSGLAHQRDAATSVGTTGVAMGVAIRRVRTDGLLRSRRPRGCCSFRRPWSSPWRPTETAEPWLSRGAPIASVPSSGVVAGSLPASMAWWATALTAPPWLSFFPPTMVDVLRDRGDRSDHGCPGSVSSARRGSGGAAPRQAPPIADRVTPDERGAERVELLHASTSSSPSRSSYP